MATPAPKKPRIDTVISEALDAWLIAEASRRGARHKSAFVVQILEALMADPESLPETPGPAPEPSGNAPETLKEEPEAIRKLQVTLEFLFKRYLFDHPARPDATDEDEEALEERWQNMATIIDEELEK